VNRDELIQALSQELETSEHSCSVFLHAFFDSVKTHLRKGEAVDLEALGSWKPVMAGNTGRLEDVRYVPATGQSAAQDGAVHGPASSIDALHFIPAEALESNGGSNAPIDVGVLVGEVNRLFSKEDDVFENDAEPQEERVSGRHDMEIPSVPEFQEVLREDTLPPPAWSEEAALLRDEEELDPSEIDDTLVEGDDDETDDSVPDMMALEDIPDPEDDEDDPSAAEALEDDVETEFEAVEDEYAETDDAVSDVDIDDTAEIGDASEADEADYPANEEDSTGEDALDDSEVFYRNRDQLYNPPKEAGNKNLLITAIVLTVGVIAIILFLVFGGNDESPLPASKRGKGATTQILQQQDTPNMYSQSLNKTFIL